MRAEGLSLHLDHVESRHPAGDQPSQAHPILAIERIGLDLPVIRQNDQLIATAANAGYFLDGSVDVLEDVERLCVVGPECVPRLVERIKPGVDGREALPHRFLDREAREMVNEDFLEGVGEDVGSRWVPPAEAGALDPTIGSWVPPSCRRRGCPPARMASSTGPRSDIDGSRIPRLPSDAW